METNNRIAMEEVIKVLNEKVIELMAKQRPYIDMSFLTDYTGNEAVESIVKYYEDQINYFERAIEILKETK